MEPGRVLFITRKWEPAIGGMETYCVKLVERMRRDRSVDVIALPGQADGRTPSVLALLWFPFTVLARWAGLRDTPAIVHLGDLAIWPLALLHWLLAPAAKIVISAHGTDVSYALRPTQLGRLYRTYQKIGAALLPHARIIANSQATAQVCRKAGWRDVAECPLATDMTLQSGIQPSHNTILFAGRMIRQKGLSWFVREVLPTLPDHITLEVVGPVVDSEEAKASMHPRAVFLGPLPQQELARRYAEALCVIVPNIDVGDGSFEGFGLVACEAAAAGGVVLASDFGGLSAAVRGGETGFLLKPSAAQQWAGKISAVAGWSKAERDAFTRSASAAARQFYNWSRVSEQTQAEYASLMTERKIA